MIPLVTIAVLSYKNLEYLNECLDSIFSQTYSNIELIISNDGADEFDEDVIADEAGKMKSENIKQIIINKNSRNLGTVKHCNILLDCSNGEYIIFIACDDTFNNNDVVKDMVGGFDCVSPDVMSIVGQTEMRTSDLSVCTEYFVSKKTQKLINELSPKDFYKNHLVQSSLFPSASRIFKKECFKKYGKFDESCFLIEDWTLSLSHAKQGMKTYYLDIIAINHRAGGVSHSKIIKDSFAQKMFTLDMIKIMENSLMDYSVNTTTRDYVNNKRDFWVRSFFEIWGEGNLPAELLESINLGIYLANIGEQVEPSAQSKTRNDLTL